MARVRRHLTVYSRQRGINPRTAARDVLLAVPGMTPEQVDAFIAARNEALANHLPIPPLPPAQAFATRRRPSGGSTSQARVPDGVTFARDAVVRPSADARRPIVVLAWQEGVAGPTADPARRRGNICTEKWNGQSLISGTVLRSG